jgi:hypothetical protein
MNWRKEGQRIRFVPDQKEAIVVQSQAIPIFQRIASLSYSKDLANWVVVVEEGHRFVDDPNLRVILSEGRKFLRKLLLVCVDWRVYQGIAKVFKPPPWENASTSP